MTHEELINSEEYKKAELERKQYNEERSVMLTMLRNRMKADKWYVKLKRWFDLQRWLLYCLLTNNRVCRYFKYKNQKSK